MQRPWAPAKEILENPSAPVPAFEKPCYDRRVRILCGPALRVSSVRPAGGCCSMEPVPILEPMRSGLETLAPAFR